MQRLEPEVFLAGVSEFTVLCPVHRCKTAPAEREKWFENCSRSVTLALTKLIPEDWLLLSTQPGTGLWLPEISGDARQHFPEVAGMLTHAVPQLRHVREPAAALAPVTILLRSLVIAHAILHLTAAVLIYSFNQGFHKALPANQYLQGQRNRLRFLGHVTTLRS